VTKTIVNEKLRSEQKRSRLAALRTPNKTKISDGYRERASIGVKVF